MNMTRILTLFQSDPDGFQFGLPTPSMEGNDQWVILPLKIKASLFDQLQKELMEQGAPALQDPVHPSPQ